VALLVKNSFFISVIVLKGLIKNGYHNNAKTDINLSFCRHKATDNLSIEQKNCNIFFLSFTPYLYIKGHFLAIKRYIIVNFFDFCLSFLAFYLVVKQVFTNFAALFNKAKGS